LVSRPREPSMKPDKSFSDKYNSVANRETMPTEAEKQLTASKKQLIKSSSSCITVENADRKAMPANAEELPGTSKKQASKCCPSGIPRNGCPEYRQLVKKYVIRCSCDTCVKYEVNNVYPVRALWKCFCMECTNVPSFHWTLYAKRRFYNHHSCHYCHVQQNKELTWKRAAEIMEKEWARCECKDCVASVLKKHNTKCSCHRCLIRTEIEKVRHGHRYPESYPY